MLLFWARGTFWNQIVIKRPAEPTWLENLLSNQWLGNLWAITAAFGTYFCMYMYRKPFTAAAFKQETLGSDAIGDWDQKAVLVSAQVIGYLLSKIIGIRVVSEAHRQQRAWIILVPIGSALE